MNKRTRLVVGLGLAVLLLMAVFAATAFAQGPGGAWGGWGRQGYGPGMMGNYGPGMMGNYGPGMMGNYGPGSMMGSYGPGGMMGFGNPITDPWSAGCPMLGAAPGQASGQPITLDQAAAAVQEYLKRYGNGDLTLAEVMEFENNFYAMVKEQSTGMGAFELLVNRYTGSVIPEPGPNMMWNTKYGHMAGFGGMMGWWNRPAGPTAITVAQARAAGQGWLDANLPGATLADDEMQFPGYYTMDFLQNGKPAGMLSVNAYTGQVWYHTWHGAFISEKEF